MASRGLRNNNPGNIRHSPTTWRGQARSQPDKAFVSFLGPEWGLRAMAKILMTYQSRGIDTVREIIDRWAPPVENNTRAYVDSVCKQVGVAPDKVINVQDPDQLIPLLQAIVLHENGSQPIPLCTFVKAVQLAGLTVKRGATDG